jgi:hypothetical protein
MLADAEKKIDQLKTQLTIAVEALGKIESIELITELEFWHKGHAIAREALADIEKLNDD